MEVSFEAYTPNNLTFGRLNQYILTVKIITEEVIFCGIERSNNTFTLFGPDVVPSFIFMLVLRSSRFPYVISLT